MPFRDIPTWPVWKSQSSSFFASRNKPKLARIDNLIKKYHQVLDMSKINILMELRSAIIDWTADKIDRNVGTGRLGAMRDLEDIVLRKLYDLDGWGRHRYLMTTCIGYEIKTGAYDENRVPASDRQRRRDEIVDVGTSVTALIGAISAAYTSYQTEIGITGLTPGEDAKILKIFMAPEFFFRGRYGAYADIGYTSNILSMMRTETSKAQYADWLFVLGSALFTSDNEVNGVKTGNLLENYALVQRGGPKTSEHHDIIVAKEFPSHVDFKHPTVTNIEWFNPVTSTARVAGVDTPNIMPLGGRRDPIYNPLDATVLRASEMVGGTIFTMDGIMFGLEVCRDHYLGRLAHSQEHGRVQIQLVPSCGMSIEDNSISCVDEGVVFNVDGDTPHVNVRINSALVPDPVEVRHAAQGGGTVRIYEAARIPWPGLVRADVALRLNMRRSVLSGTAPIR